MAENRMRISIFLSAIILMTGSNANAAIKVVYGENPIEQKNLKNVMEIKNTYETQIVELEIKHQQTEAELKAEAENKLKAEMEKAEKQLAAKQEELDRFLKKQEEEEARKKAIPSEYTLSVDLTKRVVNHMGEMPSSLPAISSEGIEAPLAAAFNSFVPLDWKVYVHQSINDQGNISWLAEGTNWVAALYQIGVRYNYTFDINWDEKWLLVNKSDLRLGMSASENPQIQVVGADVPPGTEGYMLIDGKVIKVRRTDR